MKTHKQMQDATLTENPLVALMTRDENGGRNAWRTDRVFIDDDEAEAFIAPQRHRYPEETRETQWKLYAIPCAGTLAEIVKEARDAAEADAATEGMEIEVATQVAVIGSGGRVAVPAESQPEEPKAPETNEAPQAAEASESPAENADTPEPAATEGTEAAPQG